MNLFLNNLIFENLNVTILNKNVSKIILRQLIVNVFKIYFNNIILLVRNIIFKDNSFK